MFGLNKPSTGLFGNNNAGANTGSGFGSNAGQSSGGGLFGSTSNNNTGLFGGANSNNMAGQNNTTTGGGLFGNSNATGAGGGLFGNSNSNTTGNAASSGGLFGNNNTNTATGTTTGGGLFGNNTAGNNTSTGGLFGTNNNAGSTSTGGGLFGTNNNTGNTSTGGGLFGASKPPTGGLFGNNSNNTATTNSASTGGGLFGNSSNTMNATGGMGGLFGNKPAQGIGSTGTSLFGNNQNSAGTTSGLGGGGLFGSKPTTGSSLFGGNSSNTGFGSNTNGGLFGAVQQQQQPQSALESINQLAITPLTRISDLPPQIRAEVEQLDQYIQKQVQISEHLKADDKDHDELVSSIPRDIAYLTKVQSMTMQSLQMDLKRISKSKELTDNNLSDTQMFAIILQQILTPGSKISSLELEKFFQAKIAMYQSKLDDYFRVLSDIESAVNGIHCDIFGGSHEISGSDGLSNNDNAQEDLYAMKTGLNAIISTVIEEFKLFMSTADQIASLHQKVKLLTSTK